MDFNFRAKPRLIEKSTTVCTAVVDIVFHGADPKLIIFKPLKGLKNQKGHDML
jgi:hypothetical protein